MDRFELAWAAGFFDGDGWAAAVGNRSRRQPQARINQAGPAMPEVLIRFQAAVDGVGHLGGPYRKAGRQDIWWWIASSRPDVEQVYWLLARRLCSAKARQLEIALGLKPQPAMRPQGEDLAWAAGFFDAEGCVSLSKHRSHAGYFVTQADITQIGDHDAGSEELTRFARCVGIGSIFGPTVDGMGQRRVYRWKAYRVAEIARMMALLSPRLSIAKREQADRVLRIVLAQPPLPRGNPAWGAHKTHCLHGHEYATARLHRFTPRRGGSIPRASSQCLACAREAARARRYELMEVSLPRESDSEGDGHEGAGSTTTAGSNSTS